MSKATGWMPFRSRFRATRPEFRRRVINTSNGGFFSFADVPAGFSYSVTPTGSNIFAFTTQDTGLLDGNLSLLFNAARRKYTISGFVKDGQEGLSGIPLKLTRGNNLGSTTTVTDGSGQFAFTDVLAGYDYALTSTSVYYNSYFTKFPESLRQSVRDHHGNDALLQGQRSRHRRGD